MAKKKQLKKTVKKVKLDEDLVRKVDSLVDEIERTNNFKKITDEDIEELESTLATKKVNLKEDESEEIEILGETRKIEVEKPKKKKSKQDLNKTNSYDFKFDDERLTELDSLDTSFLEGRINKNSKKTKKKIKKINDEVPKEDNKQYFDKIKLPLTILLLIVLAVILVGFGSLLQLNTIKQEKIREAQEELKKQEEKKKEEQKVQSHYLFVGDKFTMDYDIENAFSGYHLAVSGTNELTSEELKDNLRKYVYNYNPSKVFIQIGINDLLNSQDDDSENIADNIKDIIKGIKENRPYAEIYIESLYPINDSDNDKIDYELIKKLYNNKIEKINNNIKDICKNNSVTYIDIYNSLYDKKEKVLKLDYTKDGFNLSDEGYRVITRKIYEYLDV